MSSLLFPRARAAAKLRRGLATLVIIALLLPPALLVDAFPAAAVTAPTLTTPASIPLDRPLTSSPVTPSQNDTDPPAGEPLPVVGFPAPVALELTSSQAVVAPGAVVTVTVHVAPAAGDLPHGLRLTVARMPGVSLVDAAAGADVTLPALAGGSTWTQVLPVVVDGADPLA
ncbi:MAG: hypothetical protein IPK16_26175 [Anaerolineales bacterium]|nr:hypothetical protein [Anaerolineales bacterium]